MNNQLNSRRRWIVWWIATGLVLLAIGFPFYRWQQERAHELKLESDRMIGARASIYVQTYGQLKDLLANEPDPEKQKKLEQIMEALKWLAGPNSKLIQ
jgi:hypothetical protein